MTYTNFIRNNTIKFPTGKLAPKTDDDKIVSMVIPFDGFYESIHSNMLDHDESEAEHLFCNLPDYTKRGYLSEENDADSSESEIKYMLQNLLHDNIDYKEAKKEYVEAYVEKFFDRVNGEQSTINIEVETECLSSPREYNFTTDRIFVNVRLSDIQHMYAELMADNDGKVLRDMIKEKFTSRDGFMSFYRNDLESWQEKIDKWNLDHNEFGTIFEAWLTLHIDTFLDNEFEHDLACDMSEESFYAYSNAMNWAKVEKAIEEFTAEKLRHALIENPRFIPRCENTVDMFNDRKGQ